MGLCMLLYKSKNPNANEEDFIDKNEVACWSKANMLHRWFVENVQNGVDDCGYYKVSQNQIIDLIHKCEEVIELLPEMDIVCESHTDYPNKTIIKSVWEFKQRYHDSDIRVHMSEKIRKKLENILPTKDGFFFGNTEYDEGYFYDVFQAVEILEHDKVPFYCCAWSNIRSARNAIKSGLESIANQSEVIGEIQKGWVAKSGIKISKISVPIGVIAAIYEARPNVTLEIAALAIKSANGCVLKGGKEARLTNLAFLSALKKAFEPLGFCSVEFLDISRDEVLELLQMSEYIDMIVPRGGENLVKFVSQNSKIPVLKHDKGLCHIYIDQKADFQKIVPSIGLFPQFLFVHSVR